MLNVYISGTIATKPRHNEIQAIQRRLNDKTSRSRMSPRLVDHLRSSASDLARTLIDHRHWLPPDMGRPRPRLLLFILPNLTSEVTIIAAPFK